MESNSDLLIIGGGINGMGIAVDAAGRGLSVTLCEQADLANGTSWKSSKLIHGGLRYLEYYEFNLVKKALRERDILLKKAPHIIQPLSFVLVHDKKLRPAWLMRAGLFLYDHLSKSTFLKTSQGIHFAQHESGKPLKKDFKRGFIYSDCYVDDARLVVLNAMQAKEKGATILTRTKFIKAERLTDHWIATLENTYTKAHTQVKAKMLINASGPWNAEVFQLLQIPMHHSITLVKGSHIVVPKLYEGDYAYVLQNKDQRIVFIIPFEKNYSLIGTTDIGFTGSLDHIEIDQNEIDYLCECVNHYFSNPIQPSDIVWTYAGVRPLKGEGENLSAISRDYDIQLDKPSQQAPLLNIFGGKITTYRELAEDALEKIKAYFPSLGPPWTKASTLPGGNLPEANFEKFFESFSRDYDWLPSSLAYHYARNYGSLAYTLLKDVNTLSDLGEHFGGGLYQKEVFYLMKHEWAQTAEDILWRRTKWGIQVSQKEAVHLQEMLNHIHSL